MGHADGHGTLSLTGINGNDAATDGLRHIRTGVDGDNDDRSQPHTGIAGEGDLVVCKVGESIVDEDCLQHHGGAPEDLHIDPDQTPDQLQQRLLDGVILLGVGDGVQDAAAQADDTAEEGGDHRQDQGVSHTVQIHPCVGIPKPGNVIAKLQQNIHKNTFLSWQSAPVRSPGRWKIRLRAGPRWLYSSGR